MGKLLAIVILSHARVVRMPSKYVIISCEISLICDAKFTSIRHVNKFSLHHTTHIIRHTKSQNMTVRNTVDPLVWLPNACKNFA